MVIPKEDALFKTRPKTKLQSKCPVVLDCLFSKSSWIETATSSLSYKLGVNSEKS